MSSVYTDDASRSRVAKRLSVLPAIVGAAGVAVLPIGALATGIGDGERGWLFVWVAVALVGGTVVTGASSGLYGGLAVLIGAGLTVAGDPSRTEVFALAVTAFVTHETVRFSLDARRPSRFGPGLVGGYLARTAGAGVAVAAATVVGATLAERTPGPSALVPIGMAAAAVPLFARTLADRLNEREVLTAPPIRVALAAAITAVALVVGVVGAQARSAIETEGPGPSTAAPVPEATTTTTEQAVSPVPTPDSVRRVVALVAAIALLLALGALYLALRRPEAVFELDELDADLDDTSFGLAVPERVEQESEAIDVDDRDLARLLTGLHLDIASEPDPGRAVRFGYTNVERRLAELGISRGDAETERELLTRALPDLGDAGQALASLTRLFERARFSPAGVDEAVRQEALVAVERLLAEVAALDDGSVDR